MSEEKKDLVVQPKAEVNTQVIQPKIRRGFEDEQDGDMIMPRAKLMQANSPELADDDTSLRAGNIINSLTKEKLPEKFVPIFKFNSRVLWIDREFNGGGMACRSLDGVEGLVQDASKFGIYNKDKKEFVLLEQVQNGDCRNCKDCSLSQWDGDVPPVCTAAMNFLSMFEGEAFPVVLSFANTSHKHGKKLYSMAKMMGGDMFSKKYQIRSVKTSNNKGTYFVLDAIPAGNASDEEYRQAEFFYASMNGKAVKFDEAQDDSMGNPDAIENSATTTDF